MPRDLTHVIIADEILKRSKEPWAKRAAYNATALHMGAISHDSFLYSPTAKLSTKIHGGFGDDTRNVVVTMLDDVRAEQNAEIKAKKQAFAFGYLTHMAADTVFHPFIYSVSGSQVPENNTSKEGEDMAKARHRYAETWLDVHFMQEKGLTFDNFRPLRKIVHNIGDSRMLADFFCKNYEKAYSLNRDVSSDYRRGMLVQLAVGKVTQNQTVGGILRRLDEYTGGKLKLAVSGFYQNDRQIPALMESFKSFKHPVTGEVVHKNLHDLTEEAIVCGTKYIRAAEKYLATGDRAAFLKAVPNKNLDTGVENTKLADIKQVDPADLQALKGVKFKAFLSKGGIKKMHSGAKNEALRQRINTGFKSFGR